MTYFPYTKSGVFYILCITSLLLFGYFLFMYPLSGMWIYPLIGAVGCFMIAIMSEPIRLWEKAAKSHTIIGKLHPDEYIRKLYEGKR